MNPSVSEPFSIISVLSLLLLIPYVNIVERTVNSPLPRYLATTTRRRLTAPTQTQMTLEALVAAESEMFGLQAFTTSCSTTVDMALISELMVL